jgi:hypothetical protein
MIYSAVPLSDHPQAEADIKTMKSQGVTNGASITVVRPYAGAIDIGAKFHVVAV